VSRGWARAGDMAMVGDVAGRGQRRDVTAVHGALICKAQFGPAAVMANCVPPLMGPHSADRSDPNPVMMAVGVGPSLPLAGGTAPGGVPVRVLPAISPGVSEGMSAISGPRYSSSAVSSTKTRPTWSISRMSAERSSSSWCEVRLDDLH
jgi:hypothetical protein